MLKLKGNYVSWGWNFDENWDILETECFPYKKYQAAPPVIKSKLESHDTSISGQSLDGGTVYMYYKDREAVSTKCNGYDWTFETDALQSGAQVQLYADVEGKTPSYFTTATVKYPGSGTEEDPWRIYTAEDLQGAYNSGYYKVMNNINLTSWINENSPITGWPAIGRNSTAATYIDGGNHTISGLWIDTTEGYNGLFSNYSAGQIKNLNVQVAEGKKVKGGDYTGILIGRIANAEIINCTVKGDVEAGDYAGGLVGYTLNSKLTGSHFVGTLTGKGEYAGGLTAQSDNSSISLCSASGTVNSTDTEDTKVGGLVGSTQNGGAVSKSFANTTVKANGTGKCGGIVGHNDAVVTESYSEGNITSSGEYTGGLIGLGGNVSNCYSTANVTGTLYTAGLVGYTYGAIDKCYASGDVKGVRYGAGLVGELDGPNAVVTHSVAANNLVDLTDQSAWGCRIIGGFKNGATEPTLGSNYALSTMQVSLNNVPQKKTDNALEGVAKSMSDLQSASTYTAKGWDMANTWGVLELNSYPYLQYEKENENTEQGGTQGGNNGGTTTADYALSIDPITTSSNCVINVPINLNNQNDINGFQFDIVLPEGISMQMNNKGKYIINLGSRGDDHTFSSTLRADGSIRVVCTSLSNAIFEGSSGEICVLPLKLGETLVNGTYSFSLKNISLFDTESTNIQASDVECEIHIMNDYMTTSTANGTVGKTFELPINMVNKSTDICGFQFDVTMPAGISMAKDENGKYIINLGSRGDDYKFSTIDRGNNVVRVVCTSLSNAVFEGGQGELCSIAFESASNMKEGTYDIQFSNIRLSNTKSVDIPVDDIEGSVTLKSFTRGDVNNDGIISVADVTAAISFVLETAQPSFIFDAADMDGNGEIKVNDVTAIISMVLTDDAVATRSAVRSKAIATRASVQDSKMYIEPFSIDPGETKIINVILDNPNQISIGWQADIYLPEGLSFVKNSRGKYQTAYVAARTDEYSITSQLTSDGALRVVGVSMDNYEIEGTSGAIMTVTIKADENISNGVYTGSLKKVSLSAVNSNDVPLENTESKIQVGSAATFDIVDGTVYTNASTQQVSKLTYTRNFKNTNWQPLYVPFSMTYSDWESQGLEVARLNCFYEYDDNKDGKIDRSSMEVLMVTEGEGRLKPNHPYMIRSKEVAEKSIVVNDATLYPAEENSIDCRTIETEYNFIGTYSQITMSNLNAQDAYIMSGGSLKPSASALNPMRWYMTRASRGGQLLPLLGEIKVFVHGEDEADSIGFTFGNEADGTAYNLMGQKVSAKQKGILIRNGKKLVNK